MPEFSRYDQGVPSWADLSATDPDAARDFYAALFGWSYDVLGPELGDYAMGQVRGRTVAGLGSPPEPQPRASWTTYLSVDDLDKSLERVRDSGGSVVFGPMDIPGTGRQAIAVDPTGATVGLWQGLGFAGAELANEPGTLVWNELRTPDPDRARGFYTAVFGLGEEKIPDMDYWMLTVDGRQVAGCQPIAGGGGAEEPHWLAYFGVEDTDAAVARATAAGAEVVDEPQDKPYGRMALLRDPQGASFALVSVDAAGSDATGG